MSNYSTTTGTGSADWLMSAVKKNPEGLLLLAAGCALLLRKGGASGRQQFSRYQGYSPSYGTQDARMQRDGESGRDWAMPEGISRAADTARDYASDVSKKVSESARDYTSAAGEYAESARQAFVSQSGRIVEQTQSTVERIVREQPLAVALAGLAAGVAVAAAFPTTRIERETLGPAGQRLSEAASGAGERLTEAASAAGERLKAAAEQRGLNPDGLKEAVRDAAGTFQRSLSGDEEQGRTASRQQPRPSGGGTASYGADPLGAGSGSSSGQSGGSSFDPKPPSGQR
jgi:hypothetical protein